MRTERKYSSAGKYARENASSGKGQGRIKEGPKAARSLLFEEPSYFNLRSKFQRHCIAREALPSSSLLTLESSQ
jgi:hypothetical protein